MTALPHSTEGCRWIPLPSLAEEGPRGRSAHQPSEVTRPQGERVPAVPEPWSRKPATAQGRARARRGERPEPARIRGDAALRVTLRDVQVPARVVARPEARVDAGTDEAHADDRDRRAVIDPRRPCRRSDRRLDDGA